MAALLNAGNNALNQIYDLEIDRVNKPKRPLPSGRACRSRRRGRSPTSPTLLALRARVAGRAAWPPRMLLAGLRRRRLHLHLFGAAAAHQAARHLGERDDRDSARRAAEGRGLVVGQDDRRRSSPGTSARSSACSCSARSTTKDFADMEGDRRGGCRTLPIQLRRPAGGLDDLAVVRRSVPDDRRRRVDGHPHRQLPAAAGARRW